MSRHPALARRRVHVVAPLTPARRAVVVAAAVVVEAPVLLSLAVHVAR